MSEAARKNPSQIRNRQKRQEVWREVKHERKKLKAKERKKRQREAEMLGEDAPQPKQAKTQDNMREKDETVVEANDEEVKGEEAVDEFATYFSGNRRPKIVITTSINPSKRIYDFVRELLQVIPNSYYYARKAFTLQQITQWCVEREFTDLIVINEDRKRINGWTQFHLPEGPSARFKISSLKTAKDIPGHGRINITPPEVILNNFTTRLGHRVGRLLGSLFHQRPNFRGRRVVTFHNQRDFIFFRHHRYIFDNDKTARLQPLAPQFTLRLRGLHSGLLDTKHGEWEWLHKTEMDTSRRRFFL
jgi:ribosome production factor 1